MDGTVFWAFPILIVSSCKFQPSMYPFDTQHCPLVFGSWSYHSNAVNVTSRHLPKTYGGVTMSENGEWILKGVTTHIESRSKLDRAGDFPLLIFTLQLQRRPRFYIVHLLVPSVMLMAIGVLVFIMPSESGEKIGLAATVLMSMTVFLLFIMDHIPPSSDGVSIIARFFGGTMTLLSFEIYVSVLVLHAYYNGSRGIRAKPFIRRFLLEYVGPIFGHKPLDMSGLHDYGKDEQDAKGVMGRYMLSGDDSDNVEQQRGATYILESTKEDNVPKIGFPAPSTQPPPQGILSCPVISKGSFTKMVVTTKTCSGHSIHNMAAVAGQDSLVKTSTANVDVLMLEDVFQVLLDILDELRLCRSLLSPSQDRETLIIAEWQAIAEVTDQLCLVLFALLNITLFFAVFFFMPAAII